MYLWHNQYPKHSMRQLSPNVLRTRMGYEEELGSRWLSHTHVCGFFHTCICLSLTLFFSRTRSLCFSASSIWGSYLSLSLGIQSWWLVLFSGTWVFISSYQLGRSFMFLGTWGGDILIPSVNIISDTWWRTIACVIPAFLCTTCILLQLATVGNVMLGLDNGLKMEAPAGSWVFLLPL